MAAKLDNEFPTRVRWRQEGHAAEIALMHHALAPVKPHFAHRSLRRERILDIR